MWNEVGLEMDKKYKQKYHPMTVLESWSGANSDVSASQDRVWMTLLTTIGG